MPDPATAETLSDLERLWGLTALEKLTETQTSILYRCHSELYGATVLKHLKPIGIEDEALGGRLLSYLDGHGAVRLHAESETAHLLEYIDGPELISYVTGDKDREATDHLVESVMQIHSVTGEAPDGLTPLKRRFQSLFERVESAKPQDPHYDIFYQAAQVAEHLLDYPEHEGVLHGDIHHFNIMHHATRGWLAIDPKGLVGERLYDYANAFCNPFGYAEIVYDEDRINQMAGQIASKTGYDLERLKSFALAHAALSASWSMDGLDEGDSGEEPFTIPVAALLINQLKAA